MSTIWRPDLNEDPIVVKEEPDDDHQPAAVSYTHLTLPTNREV